jgi:hypothetical protein
MGADRPAVRTSTVPRQCSVSIVVGVVLCVAALAPARAQTPRVDQDAADRGDLFRMPDAATVFAPPTDDPRNPSRFRRPATARQTGATRIGEIQVYGNPPAFGAGATGYDSTNVKRRKARAAVKPKPGVTLPLRPPPGVVPDPVATVVPTRPSAQDQRRGTAAVPAPPLVPTLATPSQRRPATALDAFEPVGVRAGAFVLFPAVELTGGFDTNPAHVPGGKGSSIFIVAPELRLRSDWERHALNADIKGAYTAYGETFGFNADGSSTGVPNSLDRPNLDSRVNGRLDVTRFNHFDLEGRLLVGTDNPGSPNIQAGLSRLPIVTTLGTTLGYTQSFNRFELTAKGAFDRSVWQASSLTDGTTSSNDDRNFDQYGAALRASYDLKPGIKPFVEIGVDTRVYDLTDSNGDDRDSNGLNARVGSTFEITRKLTGDASIGYLTRQYKDPALSPISGATLDGSLIFTATPLTTFTATAKSTVNEVIVTGVSGDFSRDLVLQVDHTFRRWLIGTAKLGFGIDDYVGLDRVDHRWYASVALIYKLTRYTQLKAEIRRDWLNSTAPGVNYAADQFLLGIRLQR